MKGTFVQIVDKIRLRKKQHQAMFGVPGTPGFEAMKDLAIYCRAFATDVPGTTEQLMFATGMRHAFFYVYRHLHLEPEELAALFRAAVVPQPEDN